MVYHRKTYSRGNKTNDSILLLLVASAFLVVVLPAGMMAVFSYRVLSLIFLVALLLVGIFAGVMVWQRVQENKRLRALRVSDVDSMDGWAFERYVSEILRKQGYKITLTKVTGDYGGDIVARRDGVTSVLQLKRYQRVLGVEAVQQSVTAKAYYKASRSVVVTNSYFTRPAKELARVNKCSLVDRDRLASWIADFLRGE